ncbi:hypothetical protein C5167_006201 [Papaver somniferum]|uniref:Thiaminase-2/PQQC domain-containing protein n=1 Tax=Papaver somniferum TaxID=3469 RepID=A0A4Y7JFU2_PAPSO|nr:hypothetical protein C5167_006201 [Papaver somniferum]
MEMEILFMARRLVLYLSLGQSNSNWMIMGGADISKEVDEINSMHQKKKDHQNLRLVFLNNVGQTVQMKYKLAADQCEDKAAILGWSNHVKLELERHNSFIEQKLGLNPTIETALHPETEKYKEFLLATASGYVEDSETPVQQSKIPAYTLGGMRPSLRLYAFLSKEMQKLVSAYVDSHPYNKWFKEYSYKRFRASYRDAEELLDKLCNSLAQEEIEVVERVYRHAMRLEMDFFYSRQSEQTLILPIYPKLDAKKEHLMLFADFDFTCTIVASLEILANIQILTAQKPDQQWQADSFDYYGGLYSAFEKLSSPKGKAVSRIFESGVLKGISLEDIKQAGKCMELHNGCLNFFEKVNNLDVSATVSSFSGSDMLKVDGNEFRYADGIFTGEVTSQARQSVTAKLEYFDDMVPKYAHEHVRIPRSVYIADIGIVVGSNKSLIEVGNHFGITFLPLYAGVAKEQKKCFEIGNPDVWRGGMCGTLYTVTSWIEIQGFILGGDLVNEEL